MDRNAAYKMRSVKFTDASKARAQRFAEQSYSRKNARENVRNAKRGLTEVDENVFPEKDPRKFAEKQPARELTHQEKLQERLARLKEWRDQKKASEERAKAKKKAPFIVPGVCRVNNRAPVEDQNVSCIEMKTSKNCGLKKTAMNKQWNVTSMDSAVKKKPLKPFNPETILFVPTNFNFSAPVHEIGAQQQETKPQLPVNQKKKVLEIMKDSPVPCEVLPEKSLTPKVVIPSVQMPKKTPKRGVDRTKTPKTDKTKDKPSLKVNDGSHFRSIMDAEADRLNELCNTWETILSSGEVPEEEHGSIRTVIGQAQLLQRERFKQYSGLIHQYETNTGEKEITSMDLQGFWELVYIQVEDVNNKFEKLEMLKNNGWVKNETPIKKAKVGLKKKAAANRPGPAAGRSNFRAFIANARKNQIAPKSPKTPSRRSSLLFSPMRTPGSRKSLRRSAILNSAKKPIFIVTDVNSPDKENSPLKAGSPLTVGSCEGMRRTPERGSFRNGTESETCMESLTPEYSLRFRAPENVAPVFQLDSPTFSDGTESVKRSRRSIASKKGTPKRGSGRPSLLPVFQVSPVTPQDDLMSFD